MITGATYETIGEGYARRRRADPRLAERLRGALGAAHSVLNVGAGTGSYELPERLTIAAEPSARMLAQRAVAAAPAVQARAEALPFRDRSFDAVTAILTLHHWSDLTAGIAECVRVARQRVVLFTWDPASRGFWLVQEYLPAFATLDRAQFPSMRTLASAFGADTRVSVTTVPLSHDWEDGFLGAFWRRPEAYLDADVRAGISSFARMPEAAARLEQLRDDLATGAWVERHAELLEMEELDIGYRMVVAEIAREGK